MTYLLFGSSPWLLAIVMIVVLGLAIEVPTRLGKRIVSGKIPDAAWNIIQGGVLTLVAFMLGISFAQSQGRFDARRELVMTEANSIGTTWLRADQLPPQDVHRFRSILTDYAAMRLGLYKGLPTQQQIDRAQAKSDAAQAELWRIVSSALRLDPHDVGRSLLMAELNHTIDVSAEQRNALTHHVPVAVDALTLLLVLLGAILIGFSFARIGADVPVLGAAYVLASVMVVTMMIDLDRPQKGFIRVNIDPMVLQLQSMR